MPKQLIPIANRPLLEYVLENISALGVVDVGVVVGDRASEIAATIGDGSRLGVRVTYLRQERPLGLAHCVLLAREFLGDDDFIMYLGDNMLPEGVVGPAAEFAAHRPAAQVVVHRVATPHAFGVVELDSHGAVLSLQEKPREPRSDLVMTGVYFFTPAVHEAVAAIRPSARGELEITDAVQWLLDRGDTVVAREYGGYWMDAGSIEDVLACNTRILDGLRPDVAGTVDDDTVLAGSVVVGHGARLAGCRIEGPVIIGSGSVLENSHVGPYTSVGRHCTLRGTRLERSILLDGATIITAGNLYGSLIGRSVAVGSAIPGATRYRLILGDHARVEVAA